MTTIVVVVNIYTYKYYYVSSHLQLPYDILICAEGPWSWDLARWEYVQRRENAIAVGNSGTGRIHVALAASTTAAD